MTRSHLASFTTFETFSFLLQQTGRPRQVNNNNLVTVQFSAGKLWVFDTPTNQHIIEDLIRPIMQDHPQ